jgi:hypothetical protein
VGFSIPDPADGKLSHLDGLNLSRAAMLHAGAHWLTSFAMYLETKRWRVTV